MTRKTILALGSQGVLGKFTARALSAAGYDVLRGGRRAESAADFRLVDLDNPKTLVAALEGVDLVVSSIEDPEARAEREILRRGGLLLSQATIPTTARRLREADIARGVKGTVVLNSGLTGVCGLVANDLLEQHPDADTIEMGFIISASASAGLRGFKTAHAWLTAMPRLPKVRRSFTPPRGSWSCFDLSRNDIIWLSEASMANRNVLVHVGIAEKWLDACLTLLNGVGLLKAMPESLFTLGVRIRPAPDELTREPIRMRMAVYRQGKLLAARGIDAEGDYHSTAQSTRLFSVSLLDLLGRGGVQSGLRCVEDLFSLRDLHSALADNRICIQPLAI